jgi:hypothetical protein
MAGTVGAKNALKRYRRAWRWQVEDRNDYLKSEDK